MRRRVLPKWYVALKKAPLLSHTSNPFPQRPVARNPALSFSILSFACGGSGESASKSLEVGFAITTWTLQLRWLIQSWIRFKNWTMSSIRERLALNIWIVWCFASLSSSKMKCVNFCLFAFLWSYLLLFYKYIVLFFLSTSINMNWIGTEHYISAADCSVLAIVIQVKLFFFPTTLDAVFFYSNCDGSCESYVYY